MESYLETCELSFPQGPIKGAKRETLYGTPYFSFEGIPYAKPPLRELRFKAPQPAEPWSKTLDCTMFRSKPLQNNKRNGFEGSEDCLFLNVYAKKLKSEKPLPVMVFIYGGGFNTGEASRERCGPDYIMDEEVILVTFNYRLNSLGFLSFKDPELGIPGNAGLKDQVLALKWVKKYISYFNGDAENITLFGESAGGASTHYMLLTEKTKGLFHRSILMSGCALNSWASKPQTNMGYRLAQYNGYTGENIDKEVFAFLSTLEPKNLVQPDLLNEEENRNVFPSAFLPDVEPYITEDCVLPKDPFKLLKTTWSNSIPVIIGGTANEGISMYPRIKMFPQKEFDIFQNNLEWLLPEKIRQQYSKTEAQSLAKKIKQLHFGDKELNDQLIPEFMDYYSCKMFWHGFIRTVLARIEYASKAPTYLYRFDFDSPDFNFHRKLFCGTDPIRGAAHADDLSYLFHRKETFKLNKDSEEYKTIRRMVSMWTSFAKNSNPNCELIKPAYWKPLDKSDPYQSLNISNTVEVIELPEKNKLEVWSSLYKKEDLY